MFDWLKQNSETLSAVSNFGMLAIWAIYLQTFLASYRRRSRAKIVINRAVAKDLSGSCFVSNMSSEPIYIESIVVELSAGDNTWSCPVTDMYSDDPQELLAKPESFTHQGPLSPGDFMHVESFGALMNRVLDSEALRGRDEVSLQDGPVKLKIFVIADYASESLPVGAERTFELGYENGTWTIEGSATTTRQIRSRGERRHMRYRLADLA